MDVGTLDPPFVLQVQISDRQAADDIGVAAGGTRQPKSSGLVATAERRPADNTVEQQESALYATLVAGLHELTTRVSTGNRHDVTQKAGLDQDNAIVSPSSVTSAAALAPEKPDSAADVICADEIEVGSLDGAASLRLRRDDDKIAAQAAAVPVPMATKTDAEAMSGTVSLSSPNTHPRAEEPATPLSPSSGEQGGDSPCPAASGAASDSALAQANEEGERLLRTGWRGDVGTPSLEEANASVDVPPSGHWCKRLLAFVGPGWLISVGYMDPGNWATDLAGGSQFGYSLLFVVLFSSMIAMFLQEMALRLGMATGRDLAQACRDAYSRPVVWGLWITAEIAMIATDLAEVIGSAVALKLLFGIPLPAGVALTVLDVILLLFVHHRRVRLLEGLVLCLIVVVMVCFAIELAYVKAPAKDVFRGMFIPSAELVTNGEMTMLACGIIGATVMPHNLYLHSSIVQTRKVAHDPRHVREAITFATVDSTLSLSLALFVNAAILIVSAATFNARGRTDVAELEDAYELLDSALGKQSASILFAVALLAAGQNSTLTGTLAGQIVMEGFLHWRMSPVYRRLLTRGLAIIPALIVASVGGSAASNQLLVISQVILSMQLVFAVFPLVRLTSDKLKMGAHANSRVGSIAGYTIAAILGGLNVWMIIKTIQDAAAQGS